uniref:Uncharacterized protein n=1 Tax=Arundo donax TaxID=35708 RepID=A0A0A9ALK2_ARUDO
MSRMVACIIMCGGWDLLPFSTFSRCKHSVLASPFLFVSAFFAILRAICCLQYLWFVYMYSQLLKLHILVGAVLACLTTV